MADQINLRRPKSRKSRFWVQKFKIFTFLNFVPIMIPGIPPRPGPLETSYSSVLAPSRYLQCDPMSRGWPTRPTWADQKSENLDFWLENFEILIFRLRLATLHSAGRTGVDLGKPKHSNTVVSRLTHIWVKLISVFCGLQNYELSELWVSWKSAVVSNALKFFDPPSADSDEHCTFCSLGHKKLWVRWVMS